MIYQFKIKYFDCELLNLVLGMVSRMLIKFEITVEFVASTVLEPENGRS